MAEQICPTCGCTIINNPNVQEGVAYCCEPCAKGSQCTCSCCKVVEKKEQA